MLCLYCNLDFYYILFKVSINITLILIVLDSTTKEGLHTVYASNNSNTWNSGTVLYNKTVLPSDIKFEAVFRYLTYVLSAQSQDTNLELCEIGIIGE